MGSKLAIALASVLLKRPPACPISFHLQLVALQTLPSSSSSTKLKQTRAAPPSLRSSQKVHQAPFNGRPNRANRVTLSGWLTRDKLEPFSSS